jgi:PAS domain S-box-containing protein
VSPDLIDSRSAVFDAALDAIITIDHEGRVVAFNAAAERIFGFTRTMACGALLADLIIPPRFREAHLKGIKRYLETGEGPVLGRRIELSALRADGVEFPVELAITRVPDVDPPQFTGFLRDLTERRRIERRRAALYNVAEILAAAASLEASAPALLTTLCDAFDASFSALWIVDGEVMRCLQTHRPVSAAITDDDTFGALSRAMTFAPGIGLPGRVWQTRTPHWIEDVLADDNFPRNHAARQQGLRGAFGFPIRLGDDVFGMLECFSNRVLERDDDVVKLFHSIGHQMAQFIARKRAEDERVRLLVQEQRARVAAEDANKAKDDFLAIVSHELRTPLNSMLGWATLLKSGLPDEKRGRALEAIERGARAQARLVDDLLDLSRMAHGTVTLSCASIDAVASVRAAAEMMQPVAQERGVSIMTQGLAEPVTLWADRARLQQIVWNLISNAVKFTPGGGTVTVRLERIDSRRVQIVVADTGIGIRPEFLPHLFERFRQGDAAGTRSGGGLGLGLTIVRQLVELHGGSIAAESEGEGKGSRFIVTLPIEGKSA